jgi:hypothetical protein
MWQLWFGIAAAHLLPAFSRGDPFDQHFEENYEAYS